MRVLLISETGRGVPIAALMVRQGDAVDAHISNIAYANVGDGLVRKVFLDDFEPASVGEYDLIFSDGPGFGKHADNLRNLGFNVFGASRFADRVQLDEAYNRTIMKAAGVRLADDVTGTAVSTEVWFNGESPVGVNHYMFDSRLMPGNIGPDVGCMGVTVWPGSFNNRLYKEGVGKVVPLLRKAHHVGVCTLDSLVTGERVFGVRLVPHLTFDSIFALLEGLRTNAARLLHDVATGKKGEFRYMAEWMVSVRLMFYDKEKRTLSGITPEVLKHVWPVDVAKRDGVFEVAGAGNVPLVVAARGESSEYGLTKEARRRAYRTINNLAIPDVIYRNDIGSRVEHDYPLLKKDGWL